VYDDKNPASGFYQNIFYDSTKTIDSTHIIEFQNEIYFDCFFFKGKVPEKLSLSIRNQYAKVKSQRYDSLFNNFFATAFLRTSHFLLSANYCFYGPNKNDFLLYSQGKLFPTKHSLLEINVKVSETTAPYFYKRYSSNHFNWITDFEKMFFVFGDIKYSDDKYKFFIGGSLSEIDNYVFLTTRTGFIVSDSISPTPFPWQDGSVIYSAYGEKNFHLKKFHFNNKITYQRVSNDFILHLPHFVSNHSLYYDDKWFKKVMNVQIGFDVSYFSSYYADAYMPALGQYYWQNKKKIGNYPYIDFFFNMKIKHARIFFKTEHLNSGLMGAYYLAPNYPAPDRSFKVGINWVFYD
jgi:hypothetical protein